ncbi:hypothetical protein LSM04_002138 [Trypanosoma melophagium]|uniref:uncharacterized protein n=1 Tax=Trypanosoma melophagium TaxID=715481 RepID=UPI00351A4B44|nr:hypothetical protein LSM04_002138 [Trypanosoma melophagium]
MSSSEPQFATVSLLIAEDVAGTFRVPIGDETTVRRLAKDAMQRLLTRRSDGRHTFTRENISVTEVFVNCGPHKAEVFAQDLVTQVVRVKEEVLHMRLRLKEGAAGGGSGGESSAITTTNGTTTTTTTTNNNNNNNNNNNSTTDTLTTTATMNTMEGARTVEIDENSHATTAAVEHEEAVKEVREEKTTARGTKRTETKAEVTAVTKKTKEQTVESGRRSGVSVSSRQRNQQAVEKKKEKQKEEKQKPEKESAVATNSKRLTTTSSSSKRVFEPITVNVTTVDKKKKTNSTAGGMAEVQKNTGSRLGWGPEADKYFPDNYVSSPNKLMNKVHAKKTTTTTTITTTTNNNNVIAPAANTKKRTTSSSKVAEKDKEIQPPKEEESLVEKEESDAIVSRRPGWGPEADKYFPDNYTASPEKIPRLIREAKKRERQQQEEEAKRKAQEGNNDKTVVDVEEEEKKEKAMEKQIDTDAGSSAISILLKSLEDKQDAETHADLCTSRRSRTLVGRENEEEPRTAPAALTAAELTPQTTRGSTSGRGKNNSTGSRKRQLAEMTDGKNALCPVVVERQLMYDVADEAAANRTPKAQSTRQIIEGNEEKIEGQRPPGWGKEALRYFDAETYFDDPNKAKLSPEILARPVRARREVALPYYFTTISR